MPERPLQGLPAAPGLAAGRARVATVRLGDAETVPSERCRAEVRRAHEALEAAAVELEALAEKLAGRDREPEAEIVRTGVLMAGDPALVHDVERAVLDTGLAAPAALMAASERHAAAIAALGDATLGSPALLRAASRCCSSTPPSSTRNCAILAAGRETELRLLLPMVDSPAQVEATRAAIRRALPPGAGRPPSVR